MATAHADTHTTTRTDPHVRSGFRRWPRTRRSRWTLAGCIAAALFALAFVIDQYSDFALTDREFGLRIDTVREGTGMPAEVGDEVTASYAGTLPDGTPIAGLNLDDQSRTHRFFIGDGTVITGLDEGVRGMRRGGIRRLTIPPTMHYGDDGYAGVIPPDKDIVLTVELRELRPR